MITSDSEGRRSWIVFDIDGVLIDVSPSFDRAVKVTVEKLLRKCGKHTKIKKKMIRKLRRKGAFGDDFKLTEALIAAEASGRGNWSLDRFPPGENVDWFRKRFGSPLGTSIIKKTFNEFYKGEKEGLWKKEKPLVESKKLKQLEKVYAVGTVTGRNEEELDLAQRTLGYKFPHSVTRDSYLKPDYRALQSLVGKEKGFYIGDTAVDEKLVENHNHQGGNISFLMVGRDIENVKELIKRNQYLNQRKV